MPSRMTLPLPPFVTMRYLMFVTPTMMEQTCIDWLRPCAGRAAKNRPHHAVFPPIEKLFSIQITHPMRTCGVPR
jgi:hypothetical protein